MQYRKIKTALARILLLCMIAVLLTPAAFADSTGKVTADYLNIRATASSSATLAGVLPKGATVTILETLDGWYKIQSNGITGYVSSAYISTDGSTGSSTSSSSSATGSAKINAYTVNIRSGASTTSSVIANVGKGTAVTVTGEDGDWYKVEYNGQSAYVKKDYVTLDSAASSSGSSSSSSSTSSDKTGTINASYVRLRSGASLSASILKTLDKGAQMTVTGEDGDWYKVSYSGQTGYVYKTYLTVEGSSSSGSSSSSSDKTGTINATYVRFRASASTSSSILTTFSKGASVTVSATEGDWYKVSYNGQTGYVYKTYVTVEGESSSSSSDNVQSASGTGTIRGSYVRVRSGASTSSSILATVHTGTTMTITGTTGEWYQVSYNGQTGYVYKSYLVDSSSSSSTGSGTSGSAGEAIVAKAKEYLGVPYVYGGTSPSGFDCSGLVYYVYKQLGYSLYRTATAQYKNGTYVERSDLQAGDILIFYNSGMTGIGHAGIYIGDGQFIHASSGGGKVQINKLSESYYNSHYYGARRVVS